MLNRPAEQSWTEFSRKGMLEWSAKHLPGDVPDTGVDEVDIRLEAVAEVWQDALHVRWVDLGQEVKSDQMAVRPVLAHLPVLCAVGRRAIGAPLHQAILLTTDLPLGHQDRENREWKKG